MARWRHGPHLRTRGTLIRRPLLVLVFLSSVASFAGLSVLALFARDRVGASDTQVTGYFAAVAVAGMAALLGTGQRSDRGRVRRFLVPAALAWLAAGYLGLSVVRSYPAMLTVGLLFFCVVGVPGAQLLAFARQAAAGADSVGVISTVRIVFSTGSFLGFGAGGLGLAYLGDRTVFRLAALVCLGCVPLAWYVLRAAEPGRTPALTAEPTGPDPTPAPAGGRRLLLALTAAMLLFASGRIMQLAQLPILLRDTLHAPVQLVGIALAVPPLAELALMPLMAAAARRWGRGRVFLLGATASVGYYTGLALATATWQVFALQLLYALFGAATIMVGIDLAQRLLADRAGLATSIYLSHENIAVVQGSVVATLSVAVLGHQRGFAVPAAFCLVALLVTGTLFRRHPDRFDLRLLPLKSDKS